MDTRKHDLEQLRSAYKQTNVPHERRLIEKTGERIRRETGIIKSMRERLIKEHRNGNTANIRDIHEYIEKKQRYQNG